MQKINLRFFLSKCGKICDFDVTSAKMMFLRQLLIVPTFISLTYLCSGNYLYSAFAMILWIPYFVYGFISKSRAVELSEYTIGALIGLTLCLIIS